MNDGHKWITKEDAQKRIAIDYYLTLIKGSGQKLHWQDRAALQKLKDKGYYLILLSYCGVERSEEIMQDLTDQDMLQYFDKIRFTWKNVAGRERPPTAGATTFHSSLMIAKRLWMNAVPWVSTPTGSTPKGIPTLLAIGGSPRQLSNS